MIRHMIDSFALERDKFVKYNSASVIYQICLYLFNLSPTIKISFFEYIFFSFLSVTMMIQLLLLYVLPMIYATSIPHTSIKYQRFSSSKSKPFGVRFVEPQFCDPNVTQVKKFFYAKLNK